MVTVVFVHFIMEQVKQEVRQQQENMAHIHSRDSSVRASTELGGRTILYAFFGGLFCGCVPDLIENRPCNRAQGHNSLMKATKPPSVIVLALPIDEIKTLLQPDSSCSDHIENNLQLCHQQC